MLAEPASRVDGGGTGWRREEEGEEEEGDVRDQSVRREARKADRYEQGKRDTAQCKAVGAAQGVQVSSVRVLHGRAEDEEVFLIGSRPCPLDFPTEQMPTIHYNVACKVDHSWLLVMVC